MKKTFNIFALLLTAFGLYSCSNAIEQPEETKGYLQLEMTTVVSTNTRAKDVPDDYDSKTLEVRILDAERKEVKKSIYKDGKFENSEFASPIMIAPGDYTVEAHSANWDGSNSGWDAAFYAGSANVKVTAGHLAKAKVILTQDNVKVEVFWDNSFQKNFKSATAKIEMSEMEGISYRTFKMGIDQGAAYFPVGDLDWTLRATNNNDVTPQPLFGTIQNLQPRDYVRIFYSVAEAGEAGTLDVYLDESTRTYTYTYYVPRESTVSLLANRVTESEAAAAIVGGSSALLKATASGKDVKREKLALQYHKKSDANWTTVTNEQLVAAKAIVEGADGINISYQVTGLEVATPYEFQITHESVTSNTVTFTINGPDIYNGGFEEWHYEGDNGIAYPTEAGVDYWSSSNPGSGSMTSALAKITDATTEYVHSGSKAALLQSKKATASILAAASIFTGSFGSLDVTSQTASLNWGVPFTSRPSALHGFMIYMPGAVNVVNSKAKDGTPLPDEAPGSGELDHCQIYCALLDVDAPIEVSNADLSTFPKWDGSDARVIAYGGITVKTTQEKWEEFNIPLKYYNTTKKPKYLLIVASSSKYGDYFHGSGKSKLYLDDFELRY